MIEELVVALCRSVGDIIVGMGSTTLCDLVGTISFPGHTWISFTDPTGNTEKLGNLLDLKLTSIGHKLQILENLLEEL